MLILKNKTYKNIHFESWWTHGKQAHKREGEMENPSFLANSHLSLWTFSLRIKIHLLILGWTSLLVQCGGSLLYFPKNDFSFFGGLLNLLIDICALSFKIFSFSELHLLHGLLYLSDVSFSLHKNLFMFLLALLETMIMLDEDLFGFCGNLDIYLLS